MSIPTLLQKASSQIFSFFLISWLSLLSNEPILAQIPIQALQFGGNGTESITQLICSENDEYFFAGKYNHDFSIDEQMLTNVGEDDIFVSKIDETGQAIWAWGAGSAFDDEVSGMQMGDSGNLYLTGSFWIEAQFGDFTLTSIDNPKSLFLLQCTEETGEINWVQSISGTSVKIVNTLSLNSNEDIILSGYFSGQLFIGDTTLIAHAETDLFLAKFNASGTLLWAINKGTSGVTKSLKSILLSDDKIIIAGIFNDSLLLADQLMVAETADEDVFLACFDPNGQALWATKAGGVHEETVKGIDIDDLDNIYLSGNFVGVMELENGMSIESSTGWADLFLLKYAADGQALLATAFGGEDLQQNTDLKIKDEYILLTGNFRGTMNIGDNLYDAGASTAGFILQFNQELEAKNGWQLISSSSVFPNNISFDVENNVLIGGAFSGEMNEITELSPSLGAFDIFILKYSETLVGVETEIESVPEINVFPNPASSHLFIDTSLKDYEVALLDINGRVITKGEKFNEIKLLGIPSGVYFLRVSGGSFVWKGLVFVSI